MAVAKIDGRFNNIKYAIYNVYGVIHVCWVSMLWFSVILFLYPKLTHIPENYGHSIYMFSCEQRQTYTSEIRVSYIDGEMTNTTKAQVLQAYLSLFIFPVFEQKWLHCMSVF